MTLRPFPAAAAIAALFAVGAACAGEPRFVATATEDVPEATVDPDVVSTSAPTTTTSAVDVDPGPVASGTRPAVRGPKVAVGTPPTPPTTVPGPTDGSCETWRPLLERYGLPWDEFERILIRESNCTNAHAVDGDDHSHGGLQVNVLSRSVREAFEALGFDHDYLHTTEGAIHAAGNLHLVCGMAPWTTYDCGWPNGAPARGEWP